MSELAAVALVTIAAILMMGAFTRLPWLTLAALGPIIGLSAFVLIGTALVIIAGYMLPLVTAVATALILGALATSHRRRPDRRTLAAVSLSILAVAAIGAVTLSTAPTRLTPDSLQYIAMADMIAEPGGFDQIPGSMLVKRNLSTSVLHTLGSLDGQPYAASATPVVVAAGFATLAVTVWTALTAGATTRGRIMALTVLSVAFALSSNRALYDAFYVNSHGLVMACFLVVVVGGFLSPTSGGWLVAVSIAAAVIVPARPEGIILVSLGLLPVLTHPGLKPLERVLVTIPTSLTAILWFGAGLWSRAPGERGLDLADQSVGGALIGIGLVLVATLAGRPRLFVWLRPAPWVAVGTMVAILALEYRREPDLLLGSLSATVQNMAGEGMWGVSWIVLGVLAAGALFSDGFDNDRFFVIPIAGFAVMFWLLIYLREGPYRVGAGDSGNRILAHIFLVTVTYVAVAAGSRYRSAAADDEAVSAPRARHEAAP
ncbi:MAG: hypothetical protein ACFCVC_15850 [Acidimicrobiia bacterium]